MAKTHSLTHSLTNRDIQTHTHTHTHSFTNWVKTKKKILSSLLLENWGTHCCCCFFLFFSLFFPNYLDFHSNITTRLEGFLSN